MNLPFYKPKGYLTSTPIPLFLTGVSHHHARAQDWLPTPTHRLGGTDAHAVDIRHRRTDNFADRIDSSRSRRPQVPVRVDLTALFNYCAVIFLP
jgi:hypothetical protein